MTERERQLPLGFLPNKPIEPRDIDDILPALDRTAVLSSQKGSSAYYKNMGMTFAVTLEKDGVYQVSGVDNTHLTASGQRNLARYIRLYKTFLNRPPQSADSQEVPRQPRRRHGGIR